MTLADWFGASLARARRVRRLRVRHEQRATFMADGSARATGRARPRAIAAAVPALLVLARGEQLPFPDGAFDTVLATLVFCTVPEVPTALAEVRRVLRPGGVLLFLEHVRSPRPLLAALQDALTPLWRRCFGGCHVNRDTPRALRDAGFALKIAERWYGGLWVRGTGRPE